MPSVAVDNALPAVKSAADWVTPGARGAGVTELIDRMLSGSLENLRPQREHHHPAATIAAIE